MQSLPALFYTPRSAVPCWLLLWLVLLVPCFAQEAPSPATPTQEQQNRYQRLEDDRRDIERLQDEQYQRSNEISRQLSALRSEDVTPAIVEQARVDVDSIRLRQEELQTEIANSERSIAELEQAIRDLEAREQLLRNPAREGEDGAQRAEQLARTQEELNRQRIELDIARQSLENLRRRLELSQQRLETAEQWRRRLEELFRQQQEQVRREEQRSLTDEFQRRRQVYLDRNAELSRQLQQTGSELSAMQRQRLETELRTSEEQANLVQLAERLNAIENELARLQTLVDTTQASPQVLREGLHQVTGLGAEVTGALELLQRKLTLFAQQRQLLSEHKAASARERKLLYEQQELVDAVITELNDRQTRLQQAQQQSERLQARFQQEYQNALSRHLFTRHELPSSLNGWTQLLRESAAARDLLWNQVQLSVQYTWNAMAATHWPRWSGLLAAILLIWLLLMAVRRRLQGFIDRVTLPGGSFFLRGGLFLSRLLHHNLFGLAGAVILLLALWIFQVPQPGFGIIATLIVLSVCVKFLITVAWLILHSPRLLHEQRQPQLFRQWVVTLLAGGVLGGVTILAHLSNVASSVGGFIDRLFMLYLLLVVGPVLQARRFFLTVLARRYAGQSWFRGLRLVSFLLPLLLLGVALLGLAGYLNLAWTIAGYLLLALAVLAAWLVAQGLINDLAAFMQSHTARKADTDALWPQEIIGPLHKVGSVLLFLGVCTLLLRFYGWDQDATITRAWQLLFASVILVIVAYETVYFVASQLVDRSAGVFSKSLVRHLRQPLGLIFPIAAAQIIVPNMPLSSELLDNIRHVLLLAQIAAISWLVIRMVSVFDDIAVHRYLSESRDRIGARRIRTQMGMLRQIVTFAVYLIAISAMLMTFPKVRQLGTGLMASAGVAGLVIGIAARPFLANLIAGVQIGLTQPIRLDDEVVVEGEWGRVAEINPTHVIIQIWDERRLIVPLNYFNEKPFQNWTRTSTELIGSVFLHVDYTFPVEEARQQLKRILDTTELWDGRVQVLQVTDAKASTLELRALMSASDASRAWDLRCYVRERLVAFIQQKYPECLPKTRALVDADEQLGNALHRQPG